MDNMEFVWIEGMGPGFDGARLVREAVFVAEQGFREEFDAVDATAWHLVGLRAGAPFCTARLFFDKPGRAHFGRIAVLPQHRGGGMGLAVMERLVEKARALGATSAVLSAQADKRGFYEKAGFAPTGVKTMDEGVPHVEMEMPL